MSGNVSEWVWDSAKRGDRYYCGGSWYNYGSSCEVDSGYNTYAESLYSEKGFRIVRTVK